MAEGPRTTPIGIVITQRDVYEQVQAIDDKLDTLTATVGEMVTINKRLDLQHDRQNDHGERIRALEAKVLAQSIIIGIVTAAITAVVVGALSNLV